MPVMENYPVKNQTPKIIESRKDVKCLSGVSRKKVGQIMERLSAGCRYQELRGHRLHVGTKEPAWVSIPLGLKERMILAVSKEGEHHLYFVGSHEDYNNLVGPKKRRRLTNPFR